MERAVTTEVPATATLTHPMRPEYVPWFHDRQGEYGRGHGYFEALCHALPSHEILTSASARFFRRDGTAVMAAHLPATLPIIAFIDAVRKRNKAFLDELEKRLRAKESTEWAPVEGVDISPSDAIDRLMHGAFRNVAIQIHFKGQSKDRAALLHLDHVRIAPALAVAPLGHCANVATNSWIAPCLCLCCALTRPRCSPRCTWV